MKVQNGFLVPTILLILKRDWVAERNCISLEIPGDNMSGGSRSFGWKSLFDYFLITVLQLLRYLTTLYVGLTFKFCNVRCIEDLENCK